jgi:hypothetical protein
MPFPETLNSRVSFLSGGIHEKKLLWFTVVEPGVLLVLWL